jgi:hypothetical protein
MQILKAVAMGVVAARGTYFFGQIGPTQPELENFEISTFWTILG